MWIPRWRGEAYAKLYNRFGLGTFDFSAAGVVSLDQRGLELILSRLHVKRILLLFEMTRPRSYRQEH